MTCQLCGLGHAASRGFGAAGLHFVGEKIVQVLDGLAFDPDNSGALEMAVLEEIRELRERLPIYRPV